MDSAWKKLNKARIYYQALEEMRWRIGWKDTPEHFRRLDKAAARIRKWYAIVGK